VSTPVTVRLDDELLAEVDAQPGSRSEAIINLLTVALSGERVPEGLERLMLSTSQIASLDQTAERWGMSRIEAIERIVKERILREFTEERQRQVFQKGKLSPVS
jgi:metal-responsive CopG/Arc/MetJ family transcriptional regulator